MDNVFLSENMKIAIISDSHDNLPNFKKAVGWIKKQDIEVIIHCGDVSSPDILECVLADFSGRVLISLGNADADHGWEGYLFSGVEHFQDFGEIEIDGKKIAFCHFPNLAEQLAKLEKYDIVFYGHTHKPWEEKIGDCCLVNPGNLAGIHFKSTFAVFDTKTNNLELKILQQL